MQILQIGCNNGKDHVLEFVKKNHAEITKLILVDVSSDAIEACKESYKEFTFCEFLSLAVIDSDVDSIIIYMPSDDNISEHTSFRKDHLIRHNHKNIEEIIVPAININKLLEKYSLYDLDKLYVDTEGLDTNLIKAIDLDRFKIKYIQYEHAHSDGPYVGFGKNYEECKQKLLQYKYTIKGVGGDTIASLT